MPTEVVLENTGLVYSIARSLYGVEKEDLIQAGFLGLAKAYKNYNALNSEAKFSTYAYGYIYGEMYEAATGNRPVRVHKNELKLYKGVIKIKELLETKIQREVSYEEACAYAKVDYNTFLSILNALTATISVEDTELNISKRENLDDLILLKESLSVLSPIERDVINKRYIQDLSQQEAAKILGLSQAKVSRIEKNSKTKMKNFISC